jgi:hypothetical protein
LERPTIQISTLEASLTKISNQDRLETQFGLKAELKALSSARQPMGHKESSTSGVIL